MKKRIRTVETASLNRMNRWCKRLNDSLGNADDCLFANGYTAVRWNKRIKLVLREKEGNT
jgi:hypothetical protein